MKLKTLLPTALAALTLALAPLAASAGDAKARMLVIVTSPQTETQAMALVLSNQAAKAGAELHLMLCGPAGEIALKTPPAAAAEVVTPKGMSVLSLLKGLQAKGATVDVCAIFLLNRKLGMDALADGVGVAKPPVIAAEMIDAGTRLATF